MTAWPMVPLGELLRKSGEWIKLDPLAKYRQVTVKLWGQGVVERSVVTGQEIGSETRLAVRAHQFLISRIDARNGASGLVPDSLDGAVVSNDFPTFSPDLDRLEPRFLGWYSKTARFVEGCKTASEGTTNRVRLKEDRFLAISMPLPPLEEQRRIVGWIEEVSARIRDAKRLSEESDQLIHSLIPSIAKAVFDHEDWPMRTVEELVGRANLKNGLSLKSDGLESDIQCLRLSAMRNGVIDCTDSKPIAIAPAQASPYLVRSDDVFIVRGNGSKELVGQAGMVKDHLAGTIFPDLFIRVPLDPVRIFPSFFVAWWNSPLMRDKITDVAKTTSGIWKINQGHIASLPVPVPPIADQLAVLRQVEGHASRTATLQSLRSASSAELRAVLPSVLNQAFSGQL